ncbi:hypothetical protein [Leifsonia sp. P73]|uniref:hypothetical protein n=1 Tax=Leifsonia sp. P73 TaxID=3423959 RepID=UPI003DA62727
MATSAPAVTHPARRALAASVTSSSSPGSSAAAKPFFRRLLPMRYSSTDPSGRMREEAMASWSNAGRPRPSSGTSFVQSPESASSSARDARWQAVWPRERRRRCSASTVTSAGAPGSTPVASSTRWQTRNDQPSVPVRTGASPMCSVVPSVAPTTAPTTGTLLPPTVSVPVSAGWSGQTGSTGWNAVRSRITALRPSARGSTCSTVPVEARSPSG